MRMRIFLLIIACCAARISFAQSIPEITGETVDNKTVIMPRDLKGKYSLLCFASSQKAEGDLQSWLDPVYQKYIAKTGLMDDMYDVNVYFVPVLTGTNLAFAASMKKKFKEYAQDDLHPHVLFCKENGNGILNAMEMHDKDVPYFLLLDKDCKIIYRTSGAYSEQKFDAIDDLIE